MDCTYTAVTLLFTYALLNVLEH